MIRLSFVIFFALLGNAFAATWSAPSKSAVFLPELQVLDEENRSADLSTFIVSAGVGPVMLLPAYTRCQGSCPLTVRALLKATSTPAKTDYRVILLSFDVHDTAEDLRHFRKHESIPDTWQLVRSTDGAALRKFLDTFSYSFMQSQSGFEHPSQLLFLSEGLEWKGNLSGTELTAEELEEALARTHWSHLRTLASRPESWLAVGLFGLICGLVVTFVAVRQLGLSQER